MVNQKIALMVDDEQDVVDVVKDLLRGELNYLVLGATDPETAVELAKSYLFDLLILDLHMPKLDGFKVLDIVRKKQPEIKVIVITGFRERYEEQLKRIRVDKIVEKPFEFPKLKEDIVAIAGRVEARVAAAHAPIPKAKILLVDDETEQCESLKEFILDDQPNVYEVEIAETGEEGVQLTNEFEPDLVLFDIKMPHMRGDEMMDHIQRGDGHKPTLFVVVSAIALPETIERMQARGCPYVTKPFRVEELLHLIRTKCLELRLVKPANEAAGG